VYANIYKQKGFLKSGSLLVSSVPDKGYAASNSFHFTDTKPRPGRLGNYYRVTWPVALSRIRKSSASWLVTQKMINK
jgi:hypothetical protein